MMDSAPAAEHLFYVDADDYSDYDVPHIRGPRVRLGIVWNLLARKATGDYLMMGNDDLIFESPNWQERLEEEVAPTELKVACFHDGIWHGEHFAFPIVTRAWYERMGSFTAELFNFGYHDTWIFDIARRIDAHVYIGDVLVRHLNPTRGHRPADKTFLERDWSGDKERFEVSANVRADLAKMMAYESRGTV